MTRINLLFKKNGTVMKTTLPIILKAQRQTEMRMLKTEKMYIVLTCVRAVVRVRYSKQQKHTI